MVSSSILTGAVMHARHDHLKRAFTYPVYMLALDLADLPRLGRSPRLLSYNHRNVFSLYDGDYAAPLLSAPPVIPGAVRMQLVTNPRVLGYTFNPVSFFLGYDAAGELVGVVAEVNNTYGGRHRYTLDDRHRTGPRTFRTDRTFFVSPFLHGPMHYDWKFDVPPGGPVAIEMLVVDRDTDERVLTARFTATRTPLSDRALALAALRYPFMTLRVIGLIYAEALVLHARRAKFARPDPATHAPVSTRW